jgi:glycosyltransferase involved in cell wall biosynthesis
MYNVKVSICIPTYNQVDYLKKCIQSVLIQDYLNYEIIISDDSTNEDVKYYIDSLNITQNLTYYRNTPSLGSPENWNFAISKATGEYIKILHHDDFFISKNSLRNYILLLENNPDVDIAFSAAEVWYINREMKKKHFCTNFDLEKIKNDYFYLFFKNFINAPSATIYRRNINLIFDNRFKWLVDVDFYISVLSNNNNIAYDVSMLVCISNGAIGQVTQSVQYDKVIQIKEHVLLYSKIINQVKTQNNFFVFFDELFLRYDVNSIEDLKQICDVPPNLIEFLNKVFLNLHKFRTLKLIKYRLLNSKYNKRYFKIEKY